MDKRYGRYMSDYYFAYGSNMNPVRMATRGMRYRSTQGAQLSGWALRFDKRAADQQGAAFANIVEAEGELVHGVLYHLEAAAEILRMDPFEHWPERYRREKVEVMTSSGPVWTWVYIANTHWRRDGLKPSREYLNHLLSGRPWLPECYFRWLAATKCLADAG